MKCPAWLLASGLGTLLALGCDGSPASPPASPSELSLGIAVPDYDPALLGPVLAKVDRLLLRTRNGDVVRDTIIPVVSSPTGATARVRVPMHQGAGALTLEVELRQQTYALFRGSAEVAEGTSGSPERVRVFVDPVPGRMTGTPLGPSFVALGDTTSVVAAVEFLNGDPFPTGDRISWTSAHPTVAEALPGGRIVPRGNGETTVTATFGALSRSLQVFVRQEPALLSGVAPSDTTIAVGDTFRLRPLGRDVNGWPLLPGAGVGWLATGPVSVDEEGLLTALSEGTAVVRAIHEATTQRATVRVGS